MAVNKALEIVKNLNLSNKDILMIVGFLAVIGLGMTVNHYRNENIQLQTVLTTTKTKLKIERDNAKESFNLEQKKKFESKIKKQTSEIANLYRELKQYEGMKKTRTEIMEKIGELNDTQDICDELNKRGYLLCGKRIL